MKISQVEHPVRFCSTLYNKCLKSYVNDFDLLKDAINAIDKIALPVEYGGKISSENKSEFLAAVEEKAPEIEENFRYLKKLKFLNESRPQDSVGFENEEEGSEI